MNNLGKIKKIIAPLSFLLICAGLTGSLYLVAQAVSSYSATGSGAVTTADTPTLTPTCQKVTNPNANALLVPTNSQPEWTAFITNVTTNTGATLSGCATIPSAPQNLAVTGSDKSVLLNWNAPADLGGGITNYKIYRGLTTDPSTLIAEIGNIQTYFDRPLTNNLTYYYKVSAKNTAGESVSKSNEVSVVPAFIQQFYTSTAYSDSNIYRFRWNGSSWDKISIGTGADAFGVLQHVYKVVTADGDNDGMEEIYGITSSGLASLYQYKWNGSSWDRTRIFYVSGPSFYGLAVGDGNNDGVNEIYVGASDNYLYQIKWSGSTWDMTSVSLESSSVNTVAIGDGNNDNVNEVYAGASGYAIQYKYNGSSWDRTAIGNSPNYSAVNSIVVGEGNNDGANEVYFGDTYGSDNKGHIFQLKYSASTWTQTDLGSGTAANMYQIALGDGNNDGKNELYGGNGDGHIYQFKLSVVPATGGTITYSGDYTIHTFTSTGTFTPPTSVTSVDYLVVAGGGGGGMQSAGGGGAGGFRTGTGFSVTNQPYTITIGNGGAGSTATNVRGTSGSSSVFSTITSAGGGGGGSAGAATAAGLSGGSGGGGAWYTSYAGGAGNTPSVSPSQGNNGGASGGGGAYDEAGGGGGGASAVGSVGVASATAGLSVGGNGGTGSASSISGASVTYSGGGGGAAIRTSTGGTGGSGGGGNAFNNGTQPTSGTANRGGGGGGCGLLSECTTAGSGGSGIVIIRYLTADTYVWNKVDLGIGGTGIMRSIGLGDGNNDGSNEIYGNSGDYVTYQFKWGGSSWVKTVVDNGTVYALSILGLPVKVSSRMFVTSTAYNGNLGGLAGADSKCVARATAAGLGGTWKAWLSSGATDITTASSRLNHNASPGIYVNMKGDKVADSWTDLTDGGLDAPIKYDEFGVLKSGQAWTGSNSDGTNYFSQDCSGAGAGWTVSTGTGGDAGLSGIVTSTSGSWSNNGANSCNSSLPIYCVEQPANKRVFVTSTTYTGNLGGLAGADTKCQARADAVSLGGTWKSWLSSSAVSATDRLTHSDGPYMRIDGTKVVDNWSDLVDGSLDAAISITELGTSASQTATYTGTGTTGQTLGGNYCQEWTSDSAGDQNQYGGNGYTNEWWTHVGNSNCAVAVRLYCFEQ